MSEPTHTFDGVRQLMAAVNQPELQADEKPLFTLGDGEKRVTDADHSAYAKAEQLDDFKAVYNPESGRIFGCVTDDYEVVNPPQVFGPFCEEMRERDRDDVHGQMWVRDGGARGYLRMLLDESRVWPPGRAESQPVKTGFDVRWSHDGGLSVNVEGFAQDTACSNSMRRVTDSVTVKHAGDVSDRVDFREEWDQLLNQLGTFNDTLVAIVEEAMNVDVLDLSEVESEWIEGIDEPSYFDDEERGLNVRATPLTERDGRSLYGLFDYLGLPNYLALAAADRAVTRLLGTEDPTTLSAWDAYSAGTYALTHVSRATPGTGADDDHHRAIRDLLMNPHTAFEEAQREMRSRLAPDAAQDTLVGESDVGEAMQTYHERAEALEQSFGG